MTFDSEINCTPEEIETRLNFCKVCPNLAFDEKQFTKCSKSGCLINLMTSFKFKSCPEGNWK